MVWALEISLRLFYFLDRSFVRIFYHSFPGFHCFRSSSGHMMHFSLFIQFHLFTLFVPNKIIWFYGIHGRNQRHPNFPTRILTPRLFISWRLSRFLDRLHGIKICHLCPRFPSQTTIYRISTSSLACSTVLRFGCLSNTLGHCLLLAMFCVGGCQFNLVSMWWMKVRW